METRLIGSETVAEGTMRFTFEKPGGFTYRAGQSIDLSLVNPPETDEDGNMRAFSLSSAPSDDHLAITTRMRDTAFKRTLKATGPGTPLTFEGPFGDFSLHENVQRPAVLLAGGIGITPFYSILRDAAARTLPHRITLFYSNRRPEDAAFLEELAALSKQSPNFTFIPTMTGMEKSATEWSGEQGHIDSAMIHRYLSPEDAPLYYIAGPAVMLVALRDVLTKSGVSNDDIRTETFSGY